MAATLKRRWFQFSLRWLLVVVSLTAVGLALWPRVVDHIEGRHWPLRITGIHVVNSTPLPITNVELRTADGVVRIDSKEVGAEIQANTGYGQTWSVAERRPYIGKYASVTWTDQLGVKKSAKVNLGTAEPNTDDTILVTIHPNDQLSAERKNSPYPELAEER